MLPDQNAQPSCFSEAVANAIDVGIHGSAVHNVYLRGQRAVLGLLHRDGTISPSGVSSLQFPRYLLISKNRKAAAESTTAIIPSLCLLSNHETMFATGQHSGWALALLLGPGHGPGRQGPAMAPARGICTSSACSIHESKCTVLRVTASSTTFWDSAEPSYLSAPQQTRVEKRQHCVPGLAGPERSVLQKVLCVT